jgi:hypothetical protein
MSHLNMKNLPKAYLAKQEQSIDQIKDCPNCQGGRLLDIEFDSDSGQLLSETDLGVCPKCDGQPMGIGCAVCDDWGRSSDFEFHHWDYQNHNGVILCSKCHGYIHDGVRARDQYAGPEGDWKITAYNNLVNLYERHNGKIEDWEKFWKRLNIENYDFAVVSE